MNFNGAVQVDKERIKQFLDVWKENKEYYDKVVEETTEEAAVEHKDWWEGLSWVGKLLYYKWRELEGTVLLKWKFEKIHRLYVGEYFDNTDYNLRFIGKLPYVLRWSYLVDDKELASDIFSMYKGGEYVWLNPEQAELVNTFLEMKPLTELLEEFENEGKE